MHADPVIPDLPAVAHQGRPVLTTELLAREYGVEVDVVHDGYRKNPERFVEGIHFFKLTGAGLRAFKHQPDTSRLVDKHAAHLMLWTERGAARHAKLISTDEAWHVFGRLEDSQRARP